MWNVVAQWVVLAVLSYFLRPSPPPAPRPATLEQFDVPLAKEGQEIGVLFGTRDIKNANVTWYGDMRVRAIKKKGGKK
jgi:hypothetical protein